LKIANGYIPTQNTGDHGYYGEHPNSKTGYDEYAFYDLPNGLCLEGRAYVGANTFEFHNVLTVKERDERIEYLISTAKDDE